MTNCAKCGKPLKPHFTLAEYMGWRCCHSCAGAEHRAHGYIITILVLAALGFLCFALAGCSTKPKQKAEIAKAEKLQLSAFSFQLSPTLPPSPPGTEMHGARATAGIPAVGFVAPACDLTISGDIWAPVQLKPNETACGGSVPAMNLTMFSGYETAECGVWMNQGSSLNNLTMEAAGYANPFYGFAALVGVPENSPSLSFSVTNAGFYGDTDCIFINTLSPITATFTGGFSTSNWDHVATRLGPHNFTFNNWTFGDNYWNSQFGGWGCGGFSLFGDGTYLFNGSRFFFKNTTGAVMILAGSPTITLKDSLVVALPPLIDGSQTSGGLLVLDNTDLPNDFIIPGKMVVVRKLCDTNHNPPDFVTAISNSVIYEAWRSCGIVRVTAINKADNEKIQVSSDVVKWTDLPPPDEASKSHFSMLFDVQSGSLFVRTATYPL